MIFDFIEKHKIAFVVIATLIFFAVYMGVSNAARASRQDPQEEAIEETAQDAEDSGGDAGAVSTKGLTEEQRAYVKDYDQQEQAIIAQLAATPWREGDGQGTLSFTASGTFTETLPADTDGARAAEKRKRSLAIVAVDGHPVGASQDGATSVTTFIGLMEDGTYQVFHLTQTQVPDSDTPNPILYLESDALGGTGSFTNQGAWEDLDIQGVGKEVSEAVDGKTKDLKACLTDYVSAYHSACATATWDKSFSVNYADNTVMVGFTLTSSVLDSSGAPEESYILITYHMDTKTFEGSEA